MDIHVKVEMYRGGLKDFLSVVQCPLLSKCCDNLSPIVGVSADQLGSIRSRHGPARETSHGMDQLGSLRSRHGPAREPSFTAWTSLGAFVHSMDQL
jgi:hypothetical protein